jgi:glycosyltransferase involved in cell wall biosynthesis
VIPTRGRPEYLDVTLASVVPQANRADAEVLVVCDGADPQTSGVAERHGVRMLALATSPGLNAARNAGARATSGELIVFIDDDIEAPNGWLAALLDGVRAAPDRDVFGGPIRPRLEGGGPRSCGREPPPITTLELGQEDRDVPLVWGANMAVRRQVLDAVGPFDEAIGGTGDEEDWERRYAARGGLVRYVAGAGLDHRRTAADATLRALSRAAYARGRAARRYDEHKGTSPTIPRELRTLAGCGWHLVRRRCGYGLVFAALTAGRLREALTAGRLREALSKRRV